MIVASELDLDQFIDPEPGERLIEFEVWSYWNEMGYPVERIEELYSVVNQKQGEENTGHLVAKVITLDKPVNVADAAVDQTTAWTCDCKGYQYHYSVDLEERRIGEWGSCPHVEACAKEVRAVNDDQQATL